MREDPIEIRPNAVYTLAEVCEILQISDATARRQLKSGMLRSGRVGRAYRVLGSYLLEALNNNASDPSPNGTPKRRSSTSGNRR